MNSIVKNYSIRIVREAGDDPLTGTHYEQAEQLIEVEAASQQSAVTVASLICTIPFRGQIRRTYIDGMEYFNERY